MAAGCRRGWAVQVRAGLLVQGERWADFLQADAAAAIAAARCAVASPTHLPGEPATSPRDQP